MRRESRDSNLEEEDGVFYVSATALTIPARLAIPSPPLLLLSAASFCTMAPIEFEPLTSL